jgi:hypothetical protein
MVIDTPTPGVDKSTSLRSLESLSSNASSACSDDPAMKRSTPRTRTPCKRQNLCDTNARRIDEVVERIADIRVSFCPSISEVVCEVMSREDFTEEERKELYMTIADMHEIKNDAKFITKYFRAKDKNSIVALDQVYTDALRMSTTFETYEDFLLFLRNDDRQLERIVESLTPWCRKSKVSGRGLERYCSQKQRSDRLAFGTECRAAVVRLSRSNAVSDDDIAKFYHEYSRGNMIYARLMGHADEITAEHVQHTTSPVVGASTQEKSPAKKRHEPTKLQKSSSTNTSERKIAPNDPEALPFVGFKTKLQGNLEKTSFTQISLPLDRRQLLALSKQQQSSSAKLLARLSSRSLESV